MTYWWSNSKHQNLAIEEMNLPHAYNAKRKLERGDYFDATGEPPSAQERLSLEAALGRRIAELEAEKESAQ